MVKLIGRANFARTASGFSGTTTTCMRSLEELEADFINDGYYRFCDLTALAVQALEKRPAVSHSQNADMRMAIRREPKGSALSPM